MVSIIGEKFKIVYTIDFSFFFEANLQNIFENVWPYL